MHACMHACTHACMYVCIFIYQCHVLSCFEMFDFSIESNVDMKITKIPNPHICVEVRIIYGAIINSYPVSGLLKFHIDITPHCSAITIQCHCALFVIIIFVSLKCSFSFRSTQRLLQLPPSTHLYDVVIRTFPQKATMHSSENINTSVLTSVWISGAENRMNSWTHEPHKLLKLNKKKICAVFNGTFIQLIVT